MPSKPRDEKLYAQIIQGLGHQAPYSRRGTDLEILGLRLLHRHPPRLMIVDQVHHLLAGTVREQRQSLNQLKFLSNELRMPVIAHGTSEALYAMQADPQIASRFEPMALPRWRESVGLREFVVKDSEVVEYALSRTLSPALVVQCQTQLPDKQMLAAKLHEFYALNAPEPPRPRNHPARGPRTQVGDCAHVCG